MGKKIDLTGKRYGHLIVLKETEPYIKNGKKLRSQWLCQCDCGNLKIIIGSNLISGRCKSCGCLQSRKNIRKKNIYDLSNIYGIGFTSNTNKEFYFDLEDYDKIKDYTWYENKNNYILTYTPEKTLYLHRVIMDSFFTDKESQKVDHIHGYDSRNDNRKNNLRICTHQENDRNSKLNSNNTSGVTGVYWDKERNKWISSIMVDHKQLYLGRYENFDDAVKARKEAEEKYFGEFAYDYSQAL